MQLSTQAERQEVAQEKAKKAKDIFRELIEVGTVTAASFVGPNAVQIDTSHRSTKTLSKRKATQTLCLSPESEVMFTSPLSFTSSEVLHTARAPNGRLALFRSVPPKEASNKKSLLIEIWTGELKETDVECTEDHAEWYFDSTFGTPTWSPDSLSLVYTAEPLPPKSEESKTKPNHEDYMYIPDHGELFTGKKQPTIFLLTLAASPFHLDNSTSSPSIHRITHSDDFKELSFGQPIFIPSDSLHLDTPKLVATGYSSLGDARKLGIVYCANRPARIFEFNLEAVFDESDKNRTKGETPKKSWKAVAGVAQSPPDLSCRSPRLVLPPLSLSTAKKSFAPLLVFVSNAVGGPHNSCAALHAVLLGKQQSVVLVPRVAVPDPKKDEDFPGLYIDQLPKECLLIRDGAPWIVMSSVWRSRNVPLAVSLKDGQIECLAPWPKGSEDPVLPYFETKKENLMSYSVLGTDQQSRILATRSGMVTLPDVVLLDLASKSGAWRVLKEPQLPSSVAESLRGLDFTVIPLPKFEPSEILLMSPIKIDQAAEASVSLPPLITSPHGGPHSTFVTSCSLQYLAWVIAGYRVALVNYPGSLGFGQEFVDALAPKLGTLEVDATLATSHYLNTLSLASRVKGSRLFMGGSHGGFIGAHLSGQYPDEYDALCLRNPVIDLPTMCSATDIPDWTYAEALVPYSFTKPPPFVTAEQHTALRSKSPSAHVTNVKTPTLLLIGTGDRRVPPDQGRMWYHALKGQGVETEMMTFTGNGHALDSGVDAEIVVWEATLDWFLRYTKF